MKTGEYRKFRVRAGSAGAGDGPGAQVRGSRCPTTSRRWSRSCGRRYTKVLEAGGPFPDLIVIDGGKGQLNAAYAALESIGLSNLVADRPGQEGRAGLHPRQRSAASRSTRMAPALRLLQRIRDEAHRFAVTFHRQARTMRDLRSELDALPGVGPRRRKTLLTRFGSVAGVRRATREELTAVVGAKAADAILEHFARM